MPFIVMLMLIGAAVGYAAGAYLRLGVSPVHAALAGAFGGVLGGMGMRFLLSGFGALIGALFGAALLIALLQVMTGRRR